MKREEKRRDEKKRKEWREMIKHIKRTEEK